MQGSYLRCAVRAQPFAQLVNVELRLSAPLHCGGLLLDRLLEGGLAAGLLLLQRLRNMRPLVASALNGLDCRRQQGIESSCILWCDCPQYGRASCRATISPASPS